MRRSASTQLRLASIALLFGQRRPLSNSSLILNLQSSKASCCRKGGRSESVNFRAQNWFQRRYSFTIGRQAKRSSRWDKSEYSAGLCQSELPRSLYICFLFVSLFRKHTTHLFRFCEILSSHAGDCEEIYVMGCDAV
jgi:hypothetical protein